MIALWLTSALAGPPMEEAIVRVADTARPAVVHIQVVKGPSWTPALQELLRAHDLELPEADEAIARATGSGFIVSADGRILTNQHVVDAAVEVSVVLADQRVFSATVVAADARTDVAVLKIDGPGPFPWLPLQDQPVRVGQVVVAVGSPFDFQSTVTTGIVSATGRRGLEEGEIQDFIQTDAAVNPGNSGGPLIDLSGRVVGINTAIYSQGADQNSGVSFAIPAPMARRIVTSLEADGSVPRPSMGLDVRDVSVVEGDPSRRGAQVSRVLPGGPAARSGLRRGDVVVRVDGESVGSADELRNLVLARAVGSKAALTIVRADRDVELEVVLADRADVGVGLVDVPDDAVRWLDMDVADDDEALRGRLGVPEGEGPLVVRVVPGGVAARLGVMAGDRVTGIGGLPVDDRESFERWSVRRGPGAVVVALDRSGERVIAILPVPPDGPEELDEGDEL